MMDHKGRVSEIDCESRLESRKIEYDTCEIN
jgi:hypothetical protein